MFWKKKNQKKEISEDFLSAIKGDEEEKNKTLAIINYLTAGILVFDKNNQLVLINSQAEKLFGVKREEILGRRLFELNSFPSFRPLVSLLGGEIKKIQNKELEITKKLILGVSSIPMIVQQEKIGTLVILHDITREKLVEMMKSEFVTLAAHQLRTPTSALKWSLRLLLDGDLGTVPKNQREILEKMYYTNEKSINLVKDLLNVARIEEGKFLSKITLSSIEEVIQSVVEVYSDEIKKRKLKFEFEKPLAPLPKVMLDVDKMKIAVENLIDNAVRYTLPGGRITVSLAEKEKEIEVQIQDTGLGIPENQQSKMFTKFFRAENVMKIETEGTGLGLFITKYIIEAHGGRIWFESGEGEGTVFYFTIPIKEEFAEYLTEEFY